MEHTYVNFISNDHFLQCIANLHKAYLKAKNNVSKKEFYKNKIDVIKLTFDSKLNNLDEEAIIQTEILRQIDKSINNAIGTFHEQILGGVKGYEAGHLKGYDIKALDNTLFADIKNKHNTMSSRASESLFQALARYADDYKELKAKCFLVQILSKKSFETPWASIINGKEYSHSRVFKISGDRFYALLTGQESALADLYKALPIAISDFVNSANTEEKISKNSALDEIKSEIVKSKRTILDQISFESYSYYLGFDKL